MKTFSSIIVIIAITLSFSACDREPEFSGTVQRVEIAQGIVYLHLSGDRVLYAEWPTLVDTTDLLANSRDSGAGSALMQSLQWWKGKSVSCRGAVITGDGKRFMVIKEGRSNLIIN